MLDPLVEVGYVARAHGVRGELRVVAHNPDSQVLGEVDAVDIGGARYRIVRARRAADAWLLTVEGVADRDRAHALRGAPVSVAREALALDDDEVLLDDLIGFAAVLADGTPWGTIAGVEIGAQDRLVVHADGVERLLPVVDDLIVAVELDAERVVVAPPEGLPEHPLDANVRRSDTRRKRRR